MTQCFKVFKMQYPIRQSRDLWEIYAELSTCVSVEYDLSFLIVPKNTRIIVQELDLFKQMKICALKR